MFGGEPFRAQKIFLCALGVGPSLRPADISRGRRTGSPRVFQHRTCTVRLLVDRFSPAYNFSAKRTSGVHMRMLTPASTINHSCRGAEMKRKTPIISAVALSVAAVFGAPSRVAAADGDSTLQFYGHFDLSFDVVTKGISDSAAQGKLGWQPQVSSNLSYVGFRGDHD